MGEVAEPPFRGIVETTQDALLLLEAARRGIIPRVSRRFTEKERGLITSGAVFIFHEEESKIKRWTDGLVWSPSRILGNFLIYRELEKRDRSGKNMSYSDVGSRPSSSAGPSIGPHGKTGRPVSRSTALQDVSGDVPHSPSVSPTIGSHPMTPHTAMRGHVFSLGPEDPLTLSLPDGGPAESIATDDGNDSMRSYSQGGMHATPSGLVAVAAHPDDGSTPAERRERKLRERQLVGSLTASFRFKEKGLIKKTLSMTINGYSQHLVSYYSLEDALCGRLRSPSTLPELSSLEIGGEFLDPEQFRFPPKVQVGPDGRLRYRGEPDMQETTPDDVSASKPLPTTASSSRRRSQPSVMAPAGPSPKDGKPAAGRPSSSSSRPTTASTRPPTASSSSSRPLSPPGYPSGPYQDFHSAIPIPQTHVRRPSSPTLFGSAPASAAYQPRNGRVYHPYATTTADSGDAGGSGPRYSEGPRRPSLRGQYSFESKIPEHSRPLSAPFALEPPPLEGTVAAASYALPLGYDTPVNASPYPPSPRTAVYPPPMSAPYGMRPSVLQPSAYAASYAPPPGPPPHSAPITYYGDSPRQASHGVRPSSGDDHQSASAPSRYQPLPSALPTTGYYGETPLPSTEAHVYQQSYAVAGPSRQSHDLQSHSLARNGSNHRQPYYPSYVQPQVMQPLASHDAGLGLFDPAYEESPLGAAVFRQPAATKLPARPPSQQYHHPHPHHGSQAPPPPPQHLNDGPQQPYPDWAAFGP